MKTSGKVVCLLVFCFILIPEPDAKRASRRKVKPTPTPVRLPWSTAEIPAHLQVFDKAARSGDTVDLVLNLLEIGHGAHLMGELDLAQKAYDMALDRIDTIDAKSKTATRARSFFVAEKEKVFKGEPYERSMAFFYRGLLAAQKGDYELARACFRSASFYDSSAAQQYEGDYVIHYWMEAKMDQLLGETERAQEVFRWAAESAEIVDLRPNPIPSTDPSANVVLVIEAGSSPVKVGVGPYGSILHFDEPLVPPPPGGIGLFIKGKELVRLDEPTEDILAQARSRGKRMADRINESKAAFKSFTDAVGTGAMVAGAGVMTQARDSDDMLAGGIVLLFGAIAKGISKSANPAADTRYWQSLPTHVYIVPVRVDEPTELELQEFGLATATGIHQTVLVSPPETEPVRFLLLKLE